MWKIYVIVVLIIVYQSIVWAEYLTYEEFFKKFGTSAPEIKQGNIVKVACREGYRFIFKKCRQVF